MYVYVCIFIIIAKNIFINSTGHLKMKPCATSTEHGVILATRPRHLDYIFEQVNLGIVQPV